MKYKRELIKSNRLKNIKGITLISLVMTILILIVLASISINLLLGQNGLIAKATQTKEIREEQQAREKLELELGSLAIEKENNENYDDNFVDNYLTKKGFIVNENIVIIEGWQFQVDKNVPKIIASLGKGEEIKQIEIATKIEYVNYYANANLKLEITYANEITQVKINGEEVEIPTKIDNKYQIEKQIEKNGIYTIYVKDEKNGYKLSSTEVTDISEDMKISTPEELATFRDKVNKGATYEGKVITLTENLDLSNVCGPTIGSWKPIANYDDSVKNEFKGTFNGNNHTIDNLYIDSTKSNQGLFGTINQGKITGVVIGKNSSIKGDSCVGAIAGKILNSSTIENCGNNANVTGTGNYVGGITSTCTNSDIIATYNKGNVTTNGNIVGGITATLQASSNKKSIKYSYNAGNVKGGNYVGGIVGNGNDYAIIYNCYNKGKIQGSSIVENANTIYMGGISGRLRAYGLITYSYNIGNIENTNSGKAVGGITGSISAYDGSNNVSSRASVVSYSYNSGNITSKGITIGGICGMNGEHCTIKNCYVSNKSNIKYNTISATANVGSANNYVGKIIGNAYSTKTTYVNNTDILTNMPTVYKVVNKLNDNESDYWSNINLNEPKLLWEE